MSNLYNVPAEMRELPNWCLWKFEYELGKPKPIKRPYQANGSYASSIDPNTWTTFEAAFNMLQLGTYDGLGFMFGNTPYSGIDLDDARFTKTGESNPHHEADFARQIRVYHEFNSYSERSPSGKGCHIIVKGKTPDGKNQSRAGIEVYPAGRFFTMTGDVVNNVPIVDRSEMLNNLWVELGGGKLDATNGIDKPAIQSDEEIIRLALTHNAVTFEPLYNGEFAGNYPSQSEADQAYMNIIAYYTDNREQCGRIYSNSKLAAKDKKRKRKDYINMTVNRAFDMKVSVDFDGLNEVYANQIAVKATPEVIPATGIYPPGLIGEIAQFIYDNAPKPIPEIALAGAIGMMAGICGRAYNISGTGLNQYVLLLAMTGAGKEAAASGINKLMTATRASVPAASEFIGPSQISSGPALFKFLGGNSKSFVSIIGEFGLRLQQLSSPNANGSELSLRSLLLDLYNKSGGTETLQQSIYSDKANNTAAVQSPAFSLFGESTPERFYGVLNEDMISEGLLPRFLIIEYKGKGVYTNDDRENAPIPISLGNKLVELTSHCLTINNSPVPAPVNVKQDETSKKQLSKYGRDCVDKVNETNNEVLRQLWSRAHIKVLKMSALVAVGVNPYNPCITSDIVDWSIDLISKDIDALNSRFLAGEVGSNSFELKQSKEAVRILKEYASIDVEVAIKYGAAPDQHKNKVINNTYLSRRLSTLAPFRNDRLGKTAALKRTISNLVSEGRLVELKGADKVKYKTTGDIYYIHPDILSD